MLRLMTIQGTVMPGVGEGSHYVNRYLDYFETTLGFTCYPGTLNLKLKDKINLNGHEKIQIVPKESDLSPIDCYLITIADQFDGAIVIPHKTRHGSEVIEVIASVNLRDALNLKDGDTLPLEFE